VERTVVGDSLPVYTDYKNGRTKVITILRRCGGDVQTLRDEMQKVCDNRTVRICTGRLEVDGNFALRVKYWLIGLGL
jgi:large subunit ribosomal protein L49